MASKKRSSSKRKAHRQGLSGNPQRRAWQLGQEGRPDPDRAAALREMAYRLAGGAPPEAWWRESHERILARARALAWPTRLVDVETHAGELVGDEFYDRLQSPGTGLHPAQWLRALAEATGAALRATPVHAADWPKLWALLCGLALTQPRTPADAMHKTVREKLPEFPAIKDPLETALAEAESVAEQARDLGVEPSASLLADGARPAGESLVAEDVYGSRRLVTAPFGYDGGAPDHWYAWDVDLCWIDVVVGAGVFASPEDALREWRDAVGPAAAEATLASCPPGMIPRLLDPCLQTGPLSDMLQGHEQRDLIREYYRLRRRARDLAGSADTAADTSPFEAGDAPEAFLDWYAPRHDAVPETVTQAAATICEEWGPHEHPDERSFYACSPHRIEMAAHLIRQQYVADYADPAVDLLPEWAEWCIERSGLTADAAARSREAARSAVAAFGEEQRDEPAADPDEAPFRRPE